MRDLQKVASDVTGEQFKLFRPGGLTPFKILIKVTKTFAPDKTEPFPAWQGMQYLAARDDITGTAYALNSSSTLQLWELGRGVSG